MASKPISVKLFSASYSEISSPSSFLLSNDVFSVMLSLTDVVVSAISGISGILSYYEMVFVGNFDDRADRFAFYFLLI